MVCASLCNAIIFLVSNHYVVEAALLNNNGIVTTKLTGGSVTFNCTADGINTPKIMWRRNGQLLFNTTRLKIISFNNNKGFRPIPGTQQITSSLIISDLKDSDSSNYSCTADNEARTPVSLSSPFVLIVPCNAMKIFINMNLTNVCYCSTASNKLLFKFTMPEWKMSKFK